LSAKYEQAASITLGEWIEDLVKQEPNNLAVKSKMTTTVLLPVEINWCQGKERG
jgi:hypothetical protein